MTAPGAAGAAGSADPAELDQVGGFALALDRGYEPATHMWVLRTGPGSVRIGMDPVGIETSGTLAALSLPEVGAAVTAGQSFGQVEAVKFVGPLTSPVSGRVTSVNAAVEADPGLAEREPFGDGWLIEAELDGADLPGGLIFDPDQVRAWYLDRIEEYRLSGAIAR